MANEEHLKILKQGIEQWNKWRLENAVTPDFRGSNLSGANLSGANLSDAIMFRANLSGADLSDADLMRANLSSADLSSANLSDAKLSNTYLNHADLRDAKVIGAELSSANLSGANLSGADLSDANLLNASLNQADLSKAKVTGVELSSANLSDANLSGADLSGASLNFAFLSDANLSDANLSGAYLIGANLGDANLSGVNLIGAALLRAYLSGANLSKTKLRGADLSHARLSYANLSGADLTDADLSLSGLVETDFTNATITGCRTYGVSAWNVTLEGTLQDNLIITKKGEPVVTVDDLEVAQFIYLILNNTKIRNVIDTITSKGVLILGRFSDPQRKSVLDGLREGLRNCDLLPIVFDFDRPTDKDYTETVQTLAGMSMFVIADLTSPKSTPFELEATIKQFKIPYIPIIDVSVDPRPFAMLVDSQKSFHWVLPTRTYESKGALLDGANLKTYIIEPAFAKREQLREAKNKEPEAVLLRALPVTGNNLSELRALLDRASADDRANFQNLIGAGFGDTPELLCDHIQFLRAGVLGQFLDNRDYKQLVTDVADQIHIDWSALLRGRHWSDLSAADIEDAVVVTVVQGILRDLPDAERRRLAEELGEEAHDPNLIGELLSGGAIVLGRLSGFQIYLLATTAVGALTAVLGITLPFAIYTAITTGIGFALGPIGWAAVAIAGLIRINQPNWSKLVPAIVYISYIRHKLASPQ